MGLHDPKCPYMTKNGPKSVLRGMMTRLCRPKAGQRLVIRKVAILSIYLSSLLIVRTFCLAAFSRSTSKGRVVHSVETFRMKTVTMLRTITIMMIIVKVR